METVAYRQLQALTDQILIAAEDRRPIPTDAIDQLPPFRARLIVACALRGGATLQHGDPETFTEAALRAGRHNASQTGWWRAALGLPAREEPPPPPPPRPHQPPPGWTVAPTQESGPGGRP